MKAKLIKAYKPQKELSLENIRFTKLVFNNEEHDGYITHYNPETQLMYVLTDITMKVKEGDYFFIGEKKDKDFKMQVVK